MILSSIVRKTVEKVRWEFGYFRRFIKKRLNEIAETRNEERPTRNGYDEKEKNRLKTGGWIRTHLKASIEKEKRERRFLAPWTSRMTFVLFFSVSQ